jgi:hypothetical protein
LDAEAAGMVERLHRLYLRTLRALQDLRQLEPVGGQRAHAATGRILAALLGE